MFKSKRNFSILQAPENGSSEIQVVQESPAKKLKLFDESPVKVTNETPPPTPGEKIETRINTLSRKKAELFMEKTSLDEKIENKLSEIRQIRDTTASLSAKRFLPDFYRAVASKGQYEVRNLLNQIYNAGLEQSNQANTLISDARRRHKNKAEKLKFEMNALMEMAQEAMNKKVKQISHDIELHERTIMTIECQKRRQLSQEFENGDVTKPGEVVVEAKLERNDSTNTEMRLDDDDCVIIDEGEDIPPAANSEAEISARTPEDQNMSANNDVTNPSETTITCEYDDEETDLDEPKEDEDERSFTPLQAQRAT